MNIFPSFTADDKLIFQKRDGYKELKKPLRGQKGSFKLSGKCEGYKMLQACLEKAGYKCFKLYFKI